MSHKSEPATKADVEEIVYKIVHEVIADVVGDVATGILTVMAEKFEQFEAASNARFDALEAGQTRIENILRPTVDKVDDHELRLGRLEASTV